MCAPGHEGRARAACCCGPAAAPRRPLPQPPSTASAHLAPTRGPLQPELDVHCSSCPVTRGSHPCLITISCYIFFIFFTILQLYINMFFSEIMASNQCPLPISSQCHDSPHLISLNLFITFCVHLSFLPSLSPTLCVSASLIYLWFWFSLKFHFPLFCNSTQNILSRYPFKTLLFVYVTNGSSVAGKQTQLVSPSPPEVKQI